MLSKSSLSLFHGQVRVKRSGHGEMVSVTIILVVFISRLPASDLTFCNITPFVLTRREKPNSPEEFSIGFRFHLFLSLFSLIADGICSNYKSMCVRMQCGPNAEFQVVEAEKMDSICRSIK